MSAVDFVQILKTANTLGASWRLSPPAVKPPKPKSEVLEDETHAEEAVFHPDNRQKVEPGDFADGGKYRSIVKISMRYEGAGADDDRWAIGTGYLVAPDVLVTAGHCVYHRGDHSNGLGRVTQMKCFVGYRGKDSEGFPSVQFRPAIKVVTTAKYIVDGDRRRDVAFVKVDRPFEGNLNLFSYTDTPPKATAVLGIVGYPGDKSMNSERGTKMFELVEQVTFDLAASPRKMLEYRISTAGGQSSAPILKFKLGSRQPEVVIGTHCYGGSATNSASVIGGKHGNDYKALMAGLSNSSNAHVTDISKGIPNVTGPEPALEAGGFFDILKTIGRVVTPIAEQGLAFATPLLGPLSSPVSAIGGIALGTLRNVWRESTLEEDKTASEKLQDGIAHRAILSEAALLAVLRIDRSPANNRNMFGVKKVPKPTGPEAYMSKKTGNEATDLPVRPSSAECALQAVLEADKGDLQECIIFGDTGSAEPESFFDGLLKTVQMMGSAVVKVTRKVLASANESDNDPEPNLDEPIFVPGHLAP